MNKQQLIETYFNTQTLQEGFWQFYTDLALTALLAFILGQIYVSYGHSLSNRKAFSNNFVLLALTTMLIITVVKSSLALSLGLVGALSIVRFRSAIKEPEELAYLFFTISIGLGFGAGQRYISLLAFVFIALILVIKGSVAKASKEENLYLTVNSDNSTGLDVNKVVEVLKPYTSLISLKRLDKNSSTTEALFYVKFDSLSKLTSAEEKLRDLNPTVKLSFIEDKGLFS